MVDEDNIKYVTRLEVVSIIGILVGITSMIFTLILLILTTTVYIEDSHVSWAGVIMTIIGTIVSYMSFTSAVAAIRYPTEKEGNG